MTFHTLVIQQFIYVLKIKRLVLTYINTLWTLQNYVHMLHLTNLLRLIV